MDVNIPDDLREFLADPGNRDLQLGGTGEITEVRYYSLEHLRIRDFDFGSGSCTSTVRHQIAGVDLVESVGIHDRPDGIMIWFDSILTYGSWDDDHHVITIFPRITWGQMMRDPWKYFNGQWYPELVKHQLLRSNKLPGRRRSRRSSEADPGLF